MHNFDISALVLEKQVLSVDESKFYTPPNKLQLPETPINTSDSANSLPESDVSSSESESRSGSPTFAQDIPDQSSAKSTPSKVDKVFMFINFEEPFKCLTCKRMLQNARRQDANPAATLYPFVIKLYVFEVDHGKSNFVYHTFIVFIT